MGVDGGVVRGEAASGVDAATWRRIARAAVLWRPRLRPRLPLLLFVFAVPVLTLLVALVLQSDVDSQWRAATSSLAARGINPPSLAEVCRTATSDDLRAFCGHAHHVTLLQHAALGAIAGGLAILGAIRLAGALGRRDRRLLLLFVPGLYLTTLSVLVLIPLHAFLIMGTCYALAESSGIGYGMLSAAGVGTLAFIAMIVIVPELFGFLRVPRLNISGVTVTRPDDPRLWTFLDELARRLGTRPPDTVVVGFRPNFFVTESPVTALDQRCKGRTLYLSLPLCRILSRGELTAVVAHELAHFAGDDTRLTRYFVPVYRGASNARAHLASLGVTSFAVALLPAVAIFGYFLDAFALAERSVSRERELAADRQASLVAGPVAVGAALVKFHTFGESWQAVRWAYRQGKRAPNASLAFAEIVRGRSRPEVFDDVIERRQPHPIDSHPTLALRLQALGLTLAELQEPAMETNPADSALTLLGGYETVELELTRVLRQELQDRQRR